MGFFDFFKEQKPKKSNPLGNLVEVLQDGVCIANLTGELIYLNNAGFDLLEISKESDISKLNFFNDIIKNSNTITQLKEIVNRDNLVTNFELKLHDLKSRELEAILTINFLTDFRQQTIGFIFVFKDVTEIKEIQHQLLQSQKLESIGLMASGIAHDFNNILAAIIPNSELIKMTSPKNSENYYRAEIIEKSALRASEIAQKLLTFTRNQELQKIPININKVVKESVDLVANSLPDYVEVKLNLQKDLYHIIADSTQMQQILMNMILNAKDAMPKGGNITLTSENYQVKQNFQQGSLDPGFYIKITISDTGSGIPIEVLPKIFDPFFTTKEVGKGTGLGLSMVYGIVKNHGGTIFVNSKKDQGTQFEIIFPADEKSVPKEVEKELGYGIPDGLKVLIIDDEQYVRDILADILKYLGCEVIKANNGKNGIEIYATEQTNIDYVIIDMRMPKMDGPATISALRKINPDLRVITTSGFDDQLTEHKNGNNIVGFLPKPYSLKNVSKAFESFLHGVTE
jgi:signal transduction histidine kinase/CheY-like chemotaxis protein